MERKKAGSRGIPREICGRLVSAQNILQILKNDIAAFERTGDIKHLKTALEYRDSAEFCQVRTALADALDAVEDKS